MPERRGGQGSGKEGHRKRKWGAEVIPESGRI